MRYFYSLCSLVLLLLAGCGGSGGSSEAGGVVTLPTPDEDTDDGEAFPNGIDGLVVLASTRLDAEDSRFDTAYELVRDVFGDDAIESPDLYPADKNHTETVHIELVQNTEPAYFLFKMHRDSDWDRDRFPETDDRQRNEIKVYDGSDDILKGYYGDTMIYEWAFYVEGGMPVSNNFTHLFQLVSKTDEGSGPLLQLSAAKDDDVDQLEIRYRNYVDGALVEDSDLAVIQEWASLHDQWLQATLIVTYGEQGAMSFTVENDEEIVLQHTATDINLWDDSYEYVRPKWGIYRSLLDSDALRADEDRIRYSHFIISEAI